MDFVSPEKRPENEKDIVTNDPFWPKVSPKHYREVMRENDGTITPSRLADALKHAMIEAARQLKNWQQQKMAEGFERLAAIPALHINEVSEYCLLYERAVFALAKANLSERYRDIDTESLGHKKAGNMMPTIDEYRRDATWAIARMQGGGHSVVELI